MRLVTVPQRRPCILASVVARRFKAHYGLSATTYRKRFATQAAHLKDLAGP